MICRLLIFPYIVREAVAAVLAAAAQVGMRAEESLDVLALAVIRTVLPLSLSMVGATALMYFLLQEGVAKRRFGTRFGGWR